MNKREHKTLSHVRKGENDMGKQPAVGRDALSLSKSRRSAVVLLLLIALAAWAVLSTGAAPAVRVEVLTDPPADAIIPDDTLVETRLRVLDAAGQPIRGAHVALRLEVPPRPKLLNTDFPYVEGTTLLDLETVAPEGEVRFAAIYPIRGTYRFETRVTLPDGTTAEATPTLHIRENPAEVRNFLVLVALLFAFGLVSGWVIGRGRQATLAAGLLLLLALSPGTVLAHDPNEGGEGHAEPITVSQAEGPLRAALSVTPGRGAVGTLNTIEARLTNPDGTPTAGEVTLEAWHLEDEVTVYRFDLPVGADGVARLKVQFFDGAAHELRLTARTADGRQVTLRTPIEVEGFSPPLWLKLRVLALLLGVVAVGLILGFWLGSRPARQVRRAQRPVTS